MALRDTLRKIGGAVGDIGRATFNAIPIVPNIPAEKFNNAGIAKAGNIAEKVATIGGAVALGVGAVGIVAKALPAANNAIKTLLPVKQAGALPTAIPTAGYVQNTLSGSTKGLSLSSLLPRTIGLFQQSGAAVESAGTKVHVPVNSSGLGINAGNVLPVVVSSTGMVMNSEGLVGKSPVTARQAVDDLPASGPLEKIQEIAGVLAGEKNAPTNPTNAPAPAQMNFAPALAVGGGLFLLWLVSKFLRWEKK